MYIFTNKTEILYPKHTIQHAHNSILGTQEVREAGRGFEVEKWILLPDFREFLLLEHKKNGFLQSDLT